MNGYQKWHKFLLRNKALPGFRAMREMSLYVARTVFPQSRTRTFRPGVHRRASFAKNPQDR